MIYKSRDETIFRVLYLFSILFFTNKAKPEFEPRFLVFSFSVSLFVWTVFLLKKLRVVIELAHKGKLG